jgi:hypothetical protein
LSDAVAIQTIRAAQKAMDVVEALDHFNGHSRFKLKVRIGFETGAALTAVAQCEALYDL